MDSNRYSLLFQKGDGDVKNSFVEWGIVCCSVPFKAGGKVKELAKRIWKDEHGDDVYIPSQLKFEAYEAEFEMAYAGKELATNPFNLSLALENIDAFKRWLSGNNETGDAGADLKIYSPYETIGRQSCYLSEISDEVPHVQMKQENGNLYHENIVTFKVKFRVNDPMTDITLTMEENTP